MYPNVYANSPTVVSSYSLPPPAYGYAEPPAYPPLYPSPQYMPTPVTSPYLYPTLSGPPGMDYFGPSKAPSQGATVQWDDVNFTVKVKVGKEKVQKALLSNVFGVARGGEVLAIMGSSGAGKTTLLDALAGRIKATGNIRVNGKPVAPGEFGNYSSAYVLQGENLHSVLTVRETLSYAARLQLPANIGKEGRAMAVQKWLRLLKLNDVQNVKVGDEDTKGISGGQRRRLSVGIDLLRDPQIIFLDEPISGLDSASAFAMIKVLHDLATREARTVLMSIHQPSPRMVELLHSILVMGDGQVLFQGREQELEGYMQRFGKNGVPSHISPIEYYMDFLDELKEEEKSYAPMALAHRERAPQLLAPSPPGIEPPPYVLKKSIAADFLTLTSRNFLIMLRTPELLVGRFMFCLVVGFFIASIFWNVGTSFDSVQEISGFFLMAAALLTFTSLEVLPLFALERQIFRREYFRGAYSIGSYVVSHGFCFTISFIFTSLAFTVAHYWAVGLWTDNNSVGTFLFSWLVYFCTLFAGNAFSMLVSGVFTNPMTGTTGGTACFAFMLLLAGFFVKTDDIPPYWIWFHYISHFNYVLFGLIPNYFSNMGNTTFGCPPPNENDPTCGLTGDQIVEFFDMEDWNKWLSVIILLSIGVGWRVLHWLALAIRYGTFKKKHVA